MPDVPYGLCKCGCGQKTSLRMKRGRPGKPYEWLKGHYQRCPKETQEERLWARVERSDGCWIWTGGLKNGYGRFSYVGEDVIAHRFAYELLVGPIPDGMYLDHICHNADPSCKGGLTCLHRRCVNPAHLEPVTLVENVMRGKSPAARNARKATCAHGHELTLRPSGTQRQCRTCAAAYHRRWRLQQLTREPR